MFLTCLGQVQSSLRYTDASCKQKHFEKLFWWTSSSHCTIIHVANAKGRNLFHNIHYGRWCGTKCDKYLMLPQATKQRNQVRNRRKSEMAKLEFPKQRSSRRDSQADCSQSQSSYDHSMRTTKNKPFFLRSQSRHEQAVRQFRDQVASEYQAEVTAREFKAKSYRPLKPPRSMSAPVEKRVTLAQAPRLLSERRAQHWAKNIKPVRDQKEELQRKWEEDKKRSEEVCISTMIRAIQVFLIAPKLPCILVMQHFTFSACTEFLYDELFNINFSFEKEIKIGT